MARTTMRRSRLLFAGLSLLMPMSGCGNGSAREEPGVGIYAAAIGWFVDEHAGVGRGRSFEETVYVEAVGDADISLEVQAGVVERLEDFVTVRFIDSREEAVDTSKPGDPVRGGGLLIGLGSVPPSDGSPMRLYADRYADAENVVAYQAGAGARRHPLARGRRTAAGRCTAACPVVSRRLSADGDPAASPALGGLLLDGRHQPAAGGEGPVGVLE